MEEIIDFCKNYYFQIGTGLGLSIGIFALALLIYGYKQMGDQGREDFFQAVTKYLVFSAILGVMVNILWGFLIVLGIPVLLVTVIVISIIKLFSNTVYNLYINKED